MERARMTVDREFFLSFTGADRPWAEWLLAELDAAGYSSVSQLRDFVAGGNFALDMDRAARRARRTLGVLSPQALQAPYVQQEWAQRLAADPTGEQRALVLVRVEPCEPGELLGSAGYIDLVGLDEAAARARLRVELAAVVSGERLLPADVQFPGAWAAPVVPDAAKVDFFISYTKADQAMAEWVAWQLEAAGYRTVIQAWDFRPGRDFVTEMQRAMDGSHRVLAVVSPAYLETPFARAEWNAALATDPTGMAGRLLPVRVAEVALQGLNQPRIYIDLVGLLQEEARERLLAGVQHKGSSPRRSLASPSRWADPRPPRGPSQPLSPTTLWTCIISP
jgi:hypothetical protein